MFVVAAGMSVSAVAYVAVLLKETRGDSHANLLQQPILESETETNQSSKKISFIRGIASPMDIITLLNRSVVFSLLAGVSFFNSLVNASIQACLMFSLKARFHFKKDQLAEIFLISSVGSALSSLVLPLLALFIREETLMAFGLFARFLSMLLHSIAWSAWGIAQGSMSGVSFLAVLVSPLVFTPISADELHSEYMDKVIAGAEDMVRIRGNTGLNLRNMVETSVSSRTCIVNKFGFQQQERKGSNSIQINYGLRFPNHCI